MLERSFGITFFLKTPKKKVNLRYIYLRITVDGTTKETSTKTKWDIRRWDQRTERAIGTKEDARTVNYFLESTSMKVTQYRTELLNQGITITAKRLMDFVLGNNGSRAKLLEEFQAHNDEIKVLVERGEYAPATHTRYVTARSHVQEYLHFKYKVDDIEFRELNYEFIKDYEFFLKTVRDCSNNTTLKYITNLKKIVLRAMAKEIIVADPFKRFKGKKTKPNKKPLSKEELYILENKKIENNRLEVIRDIFVFQCYTGLAYIDVFNLKRTMIEKGVDGKLWIIGEREKTDSKFSVPLLPQAIRIIEKYKDDTICIQRGSVLPVRSNQKMNAYLKEIAAICNIKSELTTHKARRTFGSTVTLNNGVPIHVVKEMLGHHSVKQTEEYAITEEFAISKEMNKLQQRLINPTRKDHSHNPIERIEKQLQKLKNGELDYAKLAAIEQQIQELKNGKAMI